LFTIIISTVLPALAYDKQLAFANEQTITNNQINNNSNSANDSDGNTSPKVVILNFYDDEKDQFINAKPILDKYGFKVTFFIVCSWTSSNNTDRMS
jgi:peptidoglycan/xylan/chitin deacetylase (PgdA/CDA1 family)